MDLAADIGNTKAKLRYFDNQGSIIFSYDFPVSALNNFSFSELPVPEKLIVSDVSGNAGQFCSFRSQQGVQVIKMSHHLNFPVKICYKTPETLGQDRIAAICGAATLYEGYAIMVIDAGTAITYDYLDENLNYLGGNISPGIDLRFKSLNQHTSLLPLLSKEDSYKPTGTTTSEAITAGVLNGVFYEIENYIKLWSNKSERHIVIVTGGDASFLVNSIKSSIFVNLNLVPIGLKRILDLNAE